MMDFSLSSEQQEHVEKAREFTREWDIAERRAARPERRVPLEICREAFKRGLMNPHVPTEYGGRAERVLDHCLVMEEMCTGCSGIATAIDGNGLSQYPIILAGTHEQKRRFLAPMTEQLTFSAYAVTEPEAGSDVSRSRPPRSRSAATTCSTASSGGSPTARWRAGTSCSPAPARA